MKERKLFSEEEINKQGGLANIFIHPDKPLSKGEVPVAELEDFDFDKDLDKSAHDYEGEDLQVEPPTYRKPFISIKTTGAMKFSQGLCYELLDRGGYRFLGEITVVKRKFLVFTLYKYETLPKGGDVGFYKIKTPMEASKEIKGSLNKVGNIPLITELRRAELSPRNDINDGQLIPERGLFSSVEFDIGAFCFDTSLIEEGQLRLVIDTSKGTHVLRGKRLSKAEREIALHRFYQKVDLNLRVDPEVINLEKRFNERIDKIRAEEDTEADMPEEKTEEKAKPEKE